MRPARGAVALIVSGVGASVIRSTWRQARVITPAMVGWKRRRRDDSTRRSPWRGALIVVPLTFGSASVVLTPAAALSTPLATNVGRYVIALEFRGSSVAFAKHPYRCSPGRSSRDILWGTVEADETGSGGDAVVYEGVLQRSTEQTLCGAGVQTVQAHRAALVQPCRAVISGVGDVRVRLKVYRETADLQGAWVVLTPIDVIARVTGNCRSGEMRAMQKAYGERTTIEIQTPPDRLVPGRYPGELVPATMARWILSVAPSTPVVPSS